MARVILAVIVMFRKMHSSFYIHSFCIDCIQENLYFFCFCGLPLIYIKTDVDSNSSMDNGNIQALGCAYTLRAIQMMKVPLITLWLNIIIWL